MKAEWLRLVAAAHAKFPHLMGDYPKQPDPKPEPPKGQQ